MVKLQNSLLNQFEAKLGPLHGLIEAKLGPLLSLIEAIVELNLSLGQFEAIAEFNPSLGLIEHFIIHLSATIILLVCPII